MIRRSLLLVCALALGACASPRVKPAEKSSAQAAAPEALARYVELLLPGKSLDEKKIGKVRLLKAKKAGAGHVHETWFLTVDLDGNTRRLVLKVFANAEDANNNSRAYEWAKKLGVVMPDEVARSADTKPYNDRPSLVTVFIPGGTLSMHVVQQAAQGNDVAKIAGLYADAGKGIGSMHKGSSRARGADDSKGGEALQAVAKQCAEQGWCTPERAEQLKGMAGNLDSEQVAFVHGDLYEGQIIMNPKGGLRAVIDLDEAAIAEPARDVGSMLAHILIINPLTRQADWGVANPSAEESKASAQAFLKSYREAAGLGDGWPALLARAEGYMWLRVARYTANLTGDKAAKAVREILEAKRGEIFASDPLAPFKTGS